MNVRSLSIEYWSSMGAVSHKCLIELFEQSGGTFVISINDRHPCCNLCCIGSVFWSSQFKSVFKQSSSDGVARQIEISDLEQHELDGGIDLFNVFVVGEVGKRRGLIGFCFCIHRQSFFCLVVSLVKFVDPQFYQTTGTQNKLHAVSHGG